MSVCCCPLIIHGYPHWVRSVALCAASCFYLVMFHIYFHSFVCVCCWQFRSLVASLGLLTETAFIHSGIHSVIHAFVRTLYIYSFVNVSMRFYICSFFLLFMRSF